MILYEFNYVFVYADRNDAAVVFWNVNTKEKYERHVKHVLSMSSSGEHCVLATKNEDNVNPYGLILCNSIGKNNK